MANSINSNPTALSAVRIIAAHNRSLSDIQNRITTGLVIAGPKDDGANYTIAQNIRGDIVSNQAIQGALFRAQSVIDVALAAATGISDQLIEVKERMVAMQTYPVGSQAYENLKLDVEMLLKSIDSVVRNAEFQGTNLLQGTEGTSSGEAIVATPPPADFVFLVDRTSSMGPYIANVRESITRLSESLVDSGVDAQFGLMMYSETGLTKISLGGSDFTSDPADLEAGLDSITFSGGIETSLDAMVAAAGDYSYRIGATKNVVNVTDDVLQTNIGTTVNDVVNTFQAAGVTGHMIGLGTGADHTIADQTGGSTFNVADPSYDPIMDAIVTDAVGEEEAGDQLSIIINANGSDRLNVGHRPMTLQALDLGNLNLDDPLESLGHINRAIRLVVERAAHLGTDSRKIDRQVMLFNSQNIAMHSGLSNLVDADLAVEQARLQAAQVQQNLALQSLAIANNAPSFLLQLFQPTNGRS